jgi:hypothetical protein
MPEWNQMDKAGHVWTTYQVSRFSKEMWKWTGLKSSTTAILGGVSGMVLPEHHRNTGWLFPLKWGFSWGDVGANIAGAGLFVLQELYGKGPEGNCKNSVTGPKNLPKSWLGRRDAIFGTSFCRKDLERIINSQTYWDQCKYCFPRFPNS